jgi:hypothetical protein
MEKVICTTSSKNQEESGVQQLQMNLLKELQFVTVLGSK